MSGQPIPKASRGFVTAKPRKAVKRESDKRRRENRKRREVLTIVRRRDEVCKAILLVLDVDCAGPLDVHEKNYGAYRDMAWLTPSRCVLLCRAHHEWAHANAYEPGSEHLPDGLRRAGPAMRLDLIRPMDLDRPWTPSDDPA